MVQLRQITVRDLEFSYLEDGPEDGPLALCLHGFPDSAQTWRHLLPALGMTGFRAVAPWLRGYAPTGVPADGLFQTGALVADACALHEALGGDERSVIIGHDWGAFGAYGAASFAPERWKRVVTAAVPPAGALTQGFLSYDQLKRSWYTFFFQTPLADIVVPMDDLAFIDRLWADWSPGYDATADLVWVKQALREPAHLAAAIGYYRAMFDPDKQSDTLAGEQAATQATLSQPTMYLHGTTDGCMGVELAQAAAPHLPSQGSEVVIIEGAGHFLHLEKPAEVNDRIVRFLSA